MSKYKNHIITFAVALVLSGLYILFSNIGAVENASDIYKILSDAFFIPGFLIFAFGLLVFTANEGAFDMLKYGISKIFNAMKRDIDDVKYKTYYDYVKGTHEKKAAFSHYLIVGLLEIFISLIFLMLFMTC